MDATYTCNFLTSMSDHMDTSTVPSSSNLWWMRDAHFSENSLSEWSNPTQTQGSTSITCSSISDVEGADWPPAHLAASNCSGTDVNEQLKELAVNLGPENFNTSSGVVESDQSSTGIFGGATENISWSSLLLGVGETEALQSLGSSSMEGYNHDLYSWIPNKVGNSAELSVRNSEDQSRSWDFSVKSLGLEETEVNRTCGQFQYAFGQDTHQTGRLFELDAWSTIDQSKTPVTGGLPIHEFSPLDFPISNRRRKEYPKVKQKTDIYYNNSSLGNSSSSLQILGSEASYGAGSMTNFPGQSVRSNSSLEETVDVHYPIRSNEFSRRWITNTSEFPTMLSQVLPGSSTAKHGNSHGTGSSMGRSYLDCNNLRPDRGQHSIVPKRSDYNCFTEVSREVKLEPHSTVSRKKMGQSMDEGRQLVLDSALNASSLSSSEFTNQSYFKRPRLEQTNLSFKPRKEKVSERIAELQQLVSPFGKTDQASVLTEVIEYIKYMHKQVQQLSTPYLKSDGTSTLHLEAAVRNCWSSDKTKEENRQDLKNRGLCLVPLTCTSQVASHNATECWASMHFRGGSR